MTLPEAFEEEGKKISWVCRNEAIENGQKLWLPNHRPSSHKGTCILLRASTERTHPDAHRRGKAFLEVNAKHCSHRVEQYQGEGSPSRH